MATVQNIASRSLFAIQVQGADAPLEADEYADYIDALNSFMFGLEADGVRLGFTEVSNLGDEVTIPAGAVRGVVSNVAIDVAPQYGGLVSPELVKTAKEGMRTLERLGVKIVSTSYPTTLPKGAGHQAPLVSQFYTGVAAALISLSGNARATEFAALSTAVKVDGFWRIGLQQGLTGDLSGRITNSGYGTTSSKVKIALDATCSTSDTYQFYLAKNGVTIAASMVSAALSSTPASITMNQSVTLKAGDFLEIYASAETTTTDIVVTSAQFEVS